MAHRSPLPAAALISALLTLGLFLVAGGSSHAPKQAALSLNPTTTSPSQPAQELPPAPLAFEPLAAGKGYLVRGTDYALTVGAGGTQLSGQGATIRTELVGGRTARANATQRQTLVVNRYHGAKKSWRTGIPTFGRVTYPHVYRGIDLAYHGKGGALEYDFILRPGADPKRIELAVSGADRVRIDAAGNLVATSGKASFHQHRPIAFQEIRGKRRAVDARFVLDGTRVRFALGDYDRTRPLVIDPTLTYSDYIAGARDDGAVKVAVDSSGNIYVVGSTKSTSIEGAPGSRTGTDNYDTFVLRINTDHTRPWISYLGGTSDDLGSDIGLDSTGRPYISGTTKSQNFPDGDTGTGLFGPLSDGFTAAFGTNGTLRWARTWGTADGSNVHLDSQGLAIAVEGGGTTYTAITGGGPPGGGPPMSPSYGQIVQWSADGNTVDNIFPETITDGTSSVNALGVKPGCASNCTVFYTGHVTQSVDCPPPTGTVSIQKGYIGAFNFSAGSNPWGASAYNYYFEDCLGGVEPTALDVSPAGDPVIAGTDTAPGGTPKPHAFFARYAGSNGWFDLLPFGTSTETTSGVLDVTHDAQNNFIIVGVDSGKSGDLQGAIQPEYAGGLFDGTIVKIFPDGPPITGPTDDPHPAAAIVFATLFGGSASDTVSGVDADSAGNIYFVGYTLSLSKFPTQSNTRNAQVAGSLGDAFISVLRPTMAQITDGPSGTTHSRDAKFTFGAGPEPGFGHSVEEVGAKFQCRLTPVDASFGACPGDGYKNLGDGSYKFEVRAIDVGGTTAGAASREFQVDATLTPRFGIAPNPALVGRPVTFDASATTGLPAAKFEWDLDGNGSFETDSGGTPTVTQTYPSPGSINVGLRVTDVESHTATTTNTLQVNAATGPGAQFGVTINNGAQFTNDPNVTVTATFPSFTTGLLFSNDGGFGKAQTFTAKKDTPWKLDSSGPERLPKTLYVRFLTGSIASNSFQDDIILDETPPKVDQAVIAPAAGASAGSAIAARLQKFKVKMKATDKTSGVSKVQVTANKRKPGKALKYKKKFVVKSAKRPKWVRARDRAGNWSKWKKAR